MKSAASPARRVGKILYRVAVALSAVIVVLYGVYRYLARPPELTGPAPAAGIQPTDDPDTEVDERLAAVTPAPEPAMARKEYTYTFLLVARDQGNGNTDTMMVATYDTVNQTVGLVSLPRDTFINGVRESNGKNFYKLNAAYAYNGIDGLKTEVSKILGFPIDYYIKVNISGFVRLVDAVGGVEFYVAVDMSYDDPTQDLHIHYNKGSQWLSGADALKVARCRQNSYIDDAGQVHTYDIYNGADVGRTQTQRDLLTAVLKKAVANPQKFPEYIDILLNNVKTDLDLNALTYFGTKALDFDFSAGLTTAVLPGDGTITYRGWTWCYQLYPDQVLELVNTHSLNPYTTDLTADMLEIMQKD